MKLRVLADAMDEVAVEMDYYGGFAEWAAHGRQMAGAGNIAREWAEQILILRDSTSPEEIKKKEDERKERNMKWLEKRLAEEALKRGQST